METNSISAYRLTLAAQLNNDIDLLKFPELAQRVAAVNQIGLCDVQNFLLSQTNTAQSAFVKGNVDSSYNGSMWTGLEGGIQGMMAGGNATSSGLQIQGAIDHTQELENVFQAAQTKLDNIVEDADSATMESIDEPAQPGRTVVASNEENPELDDLEKLPKTPVTRKEIISDREAKTEKVKSENTEGQNRANLIQNISQGGQFFTQVFQGNNQVAQMKQQVLNNNYSAEEGTRNSGAQTAQSVFQFNPYAPNVR